MADTMIGTTLLTEEVCVECGCVFAIPKTMRDELRKTHRSFHCPNGHSQYYPGKTPEQQRIEALEKEKARLEERNQQLSQDAHIEREARHRVQYKLRATKGVLTKTKKRIAGGVCPCCNRTFVSLARHMKSQHPDFTKADETK